MTQGAVREHLNSMPPQHRVACTLGIKTLGFDSQPPTGAWAHTADTTAATVCYFSSVSHDPTLLISTVVNPSLRSKPPSPPMLRQ